MRSIAASGITLRSTPPVNPPNPADTFANGVIRFPLSRTSVRDEPSPRSDAVDAP